MPELSVPNHIAEERKKAREEAARSDVDKAYVKTEDRVLDPTLLDKSLLERMPDPTGWRILVLPYKGKGITEGGIHLTTSTLDRESLATVVAYVLKVGPTAYKDEDKFEGEAWCKEKDWVLIGRYAGARFRLEDNHEVRIINDDEVIGTISDPDDIKTL